MSYSTGFKVDIVLSDLELIKVISWNPSNTCINPKSEALFRDSLILHLFASTGIRLKEITMLNTCSFQSFGDRAWVLIDGKGGRPRKVPVSNSFIHRFQLYSKNRKIQSPSAWTPSVFPKSLRLAKISIQQMVFRRSVDILGWRVNPHKFRHSIATYWIRKGVNIRTVQILMGHTSLSSTMRYLHASAEDLISAVDLLHDSARVFSPSLFEGKSDIISRETS